MKPIQLKTATLIHKPKLCCISRALLVRSTFLMHPMQIPAAGSPNRKALKENANPPVKNVDHEQATVKKLKIIQKIDKQFRKFKSSISAFLVACGCPSTGTVAWSA
mmetsp:Transcript_9240/g.10705  ORF Transcript_9240/g.10705 Transcript_9240/m.10705 type:complete len:106 (-) Transcript_9240:350-667(-)